VCEVIVLEGFEGGEDVAKDGGILVAVLFQTDERVVVDGVVVHLALGQQVKAQVQELLQGRGVVAPDQLLIGWLVALLDGLRELEVFWVRVVGWLLADQLKQAAAHAKVVVDNKAVEGALQVDAFRAQKGLVVHAVVGDILPGLAVAAQDLVLEAEVSDLNDMLAGKEDIGELEVSVGQKIQVKVLEGLDDLRDDMLDLRLAEVHGSVELFQVRRVQKVHEDQQPILDYFGAYIVMEESVLFLAALFEPNRQREILPQQLRLLEHQTLLRDRVVVAGDQEELARRNSAYLNQVLQLDGCGLLCHVEGVC
jgi:hypothetical protein